MMLREKRISLKYVKLVIFVTSFNSTKFCFVLQGGAADLQHQVHLGRTGRRARSEDRGEQRKTEGHEEKGQKAEGQNVGQGRRLRDEPGGDFVGEMRRSEPREDREEFAGHRKGFRVAGKRGVA